MDVQSIPQVEVKEKFFHYRNRIITIYDGLTDGFDYDIDSVNYSFTYASEALALLWATRKVDALERRDGATDFGPHPIKELPAKVFTMMKIGYPGAEPDPSFTFTAPDGYEASLKVNRWARYQCMTPDVDVTFRKARTEELTWEIHDEWIP
jgi:hypothetical protein